MLDSVPVPRPAVEYEVQDLLAVTRDGLRQASDTLDGDPVAHPWRGARLDHAAADTDQKMLAHANNLAEAMPTPRRHGRVFASTLSGDPGPRKPSLSLPANIVQFKHARDRRAIALPNRRGHEQDLDLVKHQATLHALEID